MVWGLFPVDSPPGAQKYYFFSKGTYKIGRKGCDVIVHTDRGVSRHHADLVFDGMVSRGPLQDTSASFLSGVRIIDHSKYGTFINKETGSKPVLEMKNKETTLKNGDLVSFGNAIFRFSYVPQIYFIHCSKPLQRNPPLRDIISAIGACTTDTWNPGCTHVLVDESTPVTDELIDAIVQQKPVLLVDWVKVLAEKTICTEIPSYSLYFANLTLGGMSVKIVEPKLRENCLAGHTFLLGELHLYKFGDKLQSLLEMSSAKVMTVDDFCSSSQTLEAEVNNSVLLVASSGSANEFNRFHQLNSLSRVNELKLLAAIFSGHWDPLVVETPSILVSSSQSTTDETIVADSDVEIDTAISSRGAAIVQSEETKKCEQKKEMPADHVDIVADEVQVSSVKIDNGCIIERRDSKEMPADHVHILAENTSVQGIKTDNCCIIERRDKSDDTETSGHQNSDIIYSQNLIVRDIPGSILQSTEKSEVVNFKRFRKKEFPSGNSFQNLIPFSKYPYKECDREGEEAEYLREEKKRKQLEAMAEDLFNSEKVKRRGAAGTSLRGLLARG